ncbi:hypothetical protein B0A58_15660 [Flavobacterium branchiophilum NBRC 15030 = ATCC 35035]|nr:hypothetical protein B0A58_15660 [Flavobacterium branchiophilum NBRC 15030 = ATCC 35035]
MAKKKIHAILAKQIKHLYIRGIKKVNLPYNSEKKSVHLSQKKEKGCSKWQPFYGITFLQLI